MSLECATTAYVSLLISMCLHVSMKRDTSSKTGKEANLDAQASLVLVFYVICSACLRLDMLSKLFTFPTPFTKQAQAQSQCSQKADHTC